MPLSCPQGWITHVPAYRINSTVLPSQGTEHILLNAAAGEGLDQVSHMLQVA